MNKKREIVKYVLDYLPIENFTHSCVKDAIWAIQLFLDGRINEEILEGFLKTLDMVFISHKDTYSPDFHPDLEGVLNDWEVERAEVLLSLMGLLIKKDINKEDAKQFFYSVQNDFERYLRTQFQPFDIYYDDKMIFYEYWNKFLNELF